MKDTFSLFIDDLSKYVYIYLLRTQDKALDKFKVYKAKVENRLDCKIKTLRSDNWVNILTSILTIFDNGIVHQHNTPYTPQQNKVIEMKIKHL